MITLKLNALVAALGLLMLAGCEGKPASETTTKAPAPQSRPTAAVSIPSSLFADAAPAGAVALLDAKSSAAMGEQVVFEARIGGRAEPFVPDRAVFFVADSTLKSCDQLHEDDSCKRPWDYCCEPPDNLLKHMATVQIVDAGGMPLKVSLENVHGIAPLKTVVISGTVQSNEAGSFVVNADSIYVREG